MAAHSVGTGKKAEARKIPNFLACPVSGASSPCWEWGCKKNKTKGRAMREQARPGWLSGLWKKSGTEDDDIEPKSWAWWVCN